MEPKTDCSTVEIEWWVDFDDHPAGEAAAAAIKGRCANCWGRLAGRLDAEKQLTGIECRLCGRSIKGDEATREMERMCREMHDNLPKVRRGLAAKYREDAKFVLKILPDMDRNTAHFDKRIATKIAAGCKKATISRHDFPKGTAGYLYLQACAFVAGTESLPREMSVIQYSDYDFEKPRISGIDVADDGSEVRVSAEATGRSRQPSNRLLIERMGSVMMLGMTLAFACELALKAILITRQDEARKTHDLLNLYKDLPEDSEARLKADFTAIEDELKKGRHIFDRWRYFETNVGVEAIQAMVNTERALMLAKAARVLIDEGEIAGLTYKIKVNLDAEFWSEGDHSDNSYKETYGLNVTVGEAAIPWDLLMTTGGGKPL